MDMNRKVVLAGEKEEWEAMFKAEGAEGALIRLMKWGTGESGFGFALIFPNPRSREMTASYYQSEFQFTNKERPGYVIGAVYHDYNNTWGLHS